MIDEQHRNVEADEIMAKVHREVVHSQSDESRSTSSMAQTRIDNDVFDWRQIDANMEVAEGYVDIGDRMLPLLNFHPAIRWLAKLVGRIILYLSKIITIPQMHFNRSVLQTLRLIRNGNGSVQEDSIKRDRWIDRKFSEIDQREEWINTKFHEIEEQFRTLNESIDSTHAHLVHLENQFQNNMNQFQNNMKLFSETRRLISYLKADSVIHDRRLDVFLEEARKRLPEKFSENQLESFSTESYHLLDPLYLAFEDRFRGNREEIKNRLKVYLPILKTAKAGAADRPVLDIGCGRGEWLELLKDEDLVGIGLDLNQALIRQNHDRGFNVIEGEAVEYLSSLQDNSYGALTAFHFIEHLPFHQLIKFLDETVRVLKSNGIAIFETPNPENLLVGGYHFYADPTHQNPIPSYVMKFISEHRGLCRVEILKLHPFPDAFRLSGNETAERFNELFYGPRDYAVIGYKP